MFLKFVKFCKISVSTTPNLDFDFNLLKGKIAGKKKKKKRERNVHVK